ncbi:MAG: hypothetical protein ACE5KM_02380 [Planctomycetaceae bacterium]
MKGAQGLMIAAGLGVVGAVCNWFYISRKAADLDKEAFVYVKATAKVRAGDPFQEDDFEKVEIPKRYLGGLQKIAVPWELKHTAIGVPAPRSFPEDQILLQSDTRRLSQKRLAEALGPDEISWPVVVDATRFVAGNYNPGDMVLFFPPPASQVRGGGNTKRPVKAGPFRILRIGDRGGSRDVYKAGGRRSSRSNVLTVPLVFKGGKFDQPSQDLLDLMNYAGGQGLGASVQSARKKDKRGS